MATPTELDHPAADCGRSPDDRSLDAHATEDSKAGPMAWVLAVGFALAGIGLGLTALLA